MPSSQFGFELAVFFASLVLSTVYVCSIPKEQEKNPYFYRFPCAFRLVTVKNTRIRSMGREAGTFSLDSQER